MSGYILTGTPGAGKTSILRLLELWGHVVVEEAATAVIALQQAVGGAEWWNGGAFIDTILAVQQGRQARARVAGNAPIFFDRSPVCTLALSRHLGLPPSRQLAAEVDRIVTEKVYETTVFFVRNQGFVRATSARRISFEDSLAFETIHEQTYRELGFHLVDVPPGPLTERAALVQQAVQHLDGRPPRT
jgi:predicted ATPase